MCIALQIGFFNHEFRAKTARLGDGHADGNAGVARSIIQCGDGFAASLGQRHDKWLIRRRLAALPPMPVCRPIRQEERYDPAHRKPPLSMI